MPGVLIIEAMAQAGCIYFYYSKNMQGKDLIYYLAKVSCKFLKPVIPGDQVVFDVEIKSVRRSFAKLHGRATVDGEVACEADMMSAMMEP